MSRSFYNSNKYSIAGLAFLLTLSSFTYLILKNWQIADGYKIKFDGKYAHGSFSDLTGLISFNPDSLGAAKFNVSVDVASIETGNDLKNKHAKSEKWFDAEQFPKIKFTSSEVSKQDTGYVVRGTLELHGIKKDIAIPFSFQQESGAAKFYGKFKVNRGDFGIGKSTGKESDSTTVEVFVPVVSQ
ncbi:YceI family protein [Dyadobacter sp. CY326]|uniref:YceI family protein n=1 Tax=Dyadobacter sp. CY326 TaxID=2907300 RepID=UPI001F29314B|nr:YceI family protein [Dyadobacter sp. CY326]MCE7068528.1 YceI family protein [Dyadobacter sp. CY326]